MSTLSVFDGIGNDDGVQHEKGRTRISCPHVVVTGLDRLEVTLHLDFSNRSIFEKFAFLKAEVQKGLKKSVPLSFDQSKHFTWNLQRVGTKLYPYVLKSGDVSILLSSRSWDSPIPNCQIEIGSVTCHEGAFSMYYHLLTWLEDYGMRSQKATVSRVDLCADIIGLSYDELGCDEKERWISRGHNFVPFCDSHETGLFGETEMSFRAFYYLWKLTGIHLGSSRLMMRIYDKSKELRRNKTKQAFFLNHWQCSEDTPVTRVEFHIRREVLKQFKTPINTPTELNQNLDGIWQYLVQDWARQTEKPVDRENKNHKQSKISAFWKYVQSAIFCREMPKEVRERVKSLHKDIEALKVQARGCILNIAVAAGHDVSDQDGIIATCRDVLAKSLRKFMKEKYTDFVKLFEQRTNEIFVGC